MKRIIFFSKNLNVGGLEKSLIALLNKLTKSYDVTLVLEENIGILKDQLDPQIRVKEYKLSRNKIVIFRKAVNFSKRMLWLICNYNKYDFSCSYSTYSIIGSRLAQISSRNNYLYIHSDYSKVYTNKCDFINFFNSLRMKKFKGLIFVSNESRSNFNKIIQHREEYVINNLIDYEKILELSKEKIDDSIIDRSKVSFLYVGRLDNTSKNFDLLLESFSKVKSKSNLYIIGDGDYKKNIVESIGKYSIKDRVFLLGEKSNPYPYIKMCDCLVLTSKYEGFPVIYGEALVLNKRVITTIPTSDSNIDIKNYFKCVGQNANIISKEMSKIRKNESVNYNVNFVKINDSILKQIDKLVLER